MSSNVRFIRDFADKAPFEHNKIPTIFCATEEVKQIGKCHIHMPVRDQTTVTIFVRVI